MLITDFEPKMKAAIKDVKDVQMLLQHIAFAVEAHVKPHVPVLTGNLRRSIHTRVTPTQAFVGTNVEYAIFVHEGTKYMPGRPFLDQGLQDSLNAIKEISESWGDAIWKKVK